MPIRRTTEDARTPEQQRADESALRAFKAGEFLADRDKEAAAVTRARARAQASNNKEDDYE